MSTPTFGTLARELRVRANMSLADAAKALGVSRAFVSAVENGRKKVGDQYALRLNTVFDATAAELEQLRRLAAEIPSPPPVPRPKLSHIKIKPDRLEVADLFLTALNKASTSQLVDVAVMVDKLERLTRGQ